MIYIGSVLASASFHIGILYGFSWLTGLDMDGLAIGWVIGWAIAKDAADIRRHAHALEQEGR